MGRGTFSTNNEKQCMPQKQKEMNDLGLRPLPRNAGTTPWMLPELCSNAIWRRWQGLITQWNDSIHVNRMAEKEEFPGSLSHWLVAHTLRVLCDRICGLQCWSSRIPHYPRPAFNRKPETTQCFLYQRIAEMKGILGVTLSLLYWKH
jgi:hypothetical protein